MKKNLIAAAVAAMVLPAAAFAGETNFSYTYGELSYNDMDQDGVGIDGIGLEGSYQFMEQVFGFASYESLSGDGDYDTSTLAFGVGYAHPFNDKLDGFAKLALLSNDIEVGPFEDDDTGLGLEFGLRGKIAEKTELFGSYQYVDLYDDSTSGFEIGGRYWFQDNLGISLAYNDVEDADGFTLAARYEF